MKGKSKRKIELLVLSDIHLGTKGCRASELVQYLKSIEPRRIVLNGDIIDIWQFKKKYFPKEHYQVIKQLMSWMGKGIPIHYIVGNHDENLRKFVGLKLGSLRISNKLVLNLDGEKAWFFHGDVFDVTMQHSKWLAKLGAIGYDTLIIINRIVNHWLERFGRERISLSKRIKNSVKSAVKFINNFEKIASDLGIENHYDYVVCGHIHQPEIKEFSNEEGNITYLNSGDWIENLTALEFNKGEWSIYRYDKNDFTSKLKVVYESFTNKELFVQMQNEFNLLKKLH